MESNTLSRCRKAEDLFLLLKSRRDSEQAELSRLEKRKGKLEHLLDTGAAAIEFVEQVSTEERKGIKKKVEELITSCLNEVFDDSYSVEFDYGMSRNRTTVEVYALRKCEDGLCVRRQIDGIGGGLADAISLPLKLIVLLNDDSLDRVLVIDEPGKHLSVNHVPKFAHFLQTIAKRLHVQIIMSSHHTCMDQYADSVNEVQLEGSRSVVTRVK